MPDPYLVAVSALFLLIGLLMVGTSSTYVAEYYGYSLYHYGVRQLIYVVIALTLAWFLYKVSLERWYRLTPILIICSFILLIAVLIPGVGREVNGAMRWIPLGVMNVQPAEIAKLFSLVYVASYLHRHHDSLKKSFTVLFIPLMVLGALGLLLLVEPDFGSTMIIFAVGLGMIFIAGVSLWRFGTMLLLTLGGMILILYGSPYRRARLSSFLRPWEDAYNQGYQLVNSLIAIGRGKLSGVGVGESVSKLGYLPEAHTDFIFSIYAEEFGFFGVVVLIGLYMVFLSRTFYIGARAERLGLNFAAYISYGMGLWFIAQAFVHMGVAMGLLPTKGLTLPLMSYGGSSIITMTIGLAILFRVDVTTQYKELELRQQELVAEVEYEISEAKEVIHGR